MLRDIVLSGVVLLAVLWWNAITVYAVHLHHINVERSTSQLGPRPSRTQGSTDGQRRVRSLDAVGGLETGSAGVTGAKHAVPTVAPPSTEFRGGLPVYLFPEVVVRVPVATICPGDGLGSLVNLTALTNGSLEQSLTGDTSEDESSTVSGTGGILEGVDLVPSGFGSSALNLEGAYMTLGPDGCGTVYTPTTTAVCSTVLKIAGLPAVEVADCGQWLTFSSALGVTRSSTSDGPQTTISVAETDHSTFYYVVHWWDLISNDFPSIVRVEECPPNHIGYACVVRTESWEVNTMSSLRTVTTTVAYQGPLLVVSNSHSLNTTFSINSTGSSTQTIAVPTTLKHRVNETEDQVTAFRSSPSEEQTVTVMVPTTRTWYLESVIRSTTTFTSTVTVTSIASG